MAEASAGPYASLHLAPDRQPHQHPTTLFLQAGCPSCHPINSVKALKAIKKKKNNATKYRRVTHARNDVAKKHYHYLCTVILHWPKLALRWGWRLQTFEWCWHDKARTWHSTCQSLHHRVTRLPSVNQSATHVPRQPPVHKHISITTWTTTNFKDFYRFCFFWAYMIFVLILPLLFPFLKPCTGLNRLTVSFWACVEILSCCIYLFNITHKGPEGH